MRRDGKVPDSQSEVLIERLVRELVDIHGTSAFLMFHIGDVPSDKYQDPAAKNPDHYSNRQLIKANLYSLLLSEADWPEDD